MHVSGPISQTSGSFDRRVFLALAAAIAAMGCGGGASPACRTGADCASGICSSAGSCAPAPADGGPDDAGSGTDGGSLGDGGPADSGPSGDAGPTSCIPGDPATITRQQLTIVGGLHGTFRIADNAAVSPVGVATADGGTTWDLSGAYSGDQDVLVQTLPIQGQWFATSFPSATYATPLSNSSDLLGVFEETDQALQLDGVASPTSGLTQTLLSYSPPVVVLSFPLTVGATWQTTSTVTGQASGVDSAYVESYEDSVGAAGTLITPFASFPVLQVNVLRSVNGVPTDRTYSFITACYGPVGAMVSEPGVTVDDFPVASEMRRLAP